MKYRVRIRFLPGRLFLRGHRRDQTMHLDFDAVGVLFVLFFLYWLAKLLFLLAIYFLDRVISR